MADKIGDLYVEISAKADKLKSEMDKLEKEIGAKGEKMGNSFTQGFQKAAVFIGTIYGATKAMNYLHGAFDKFEERQKTMQGLDQTIKSMGKSAEYSSASILKMSQDLQKANRYTFKVGDILDVSGYLLTFDKISKETLPRATQAVIDLAAKMKTDLRSAALSLGIALDNPAEGLTRLGRAGVKFTAEEKEQIKALVEAGKAAEAQTMIFDKLEHKVGGFAAATQTSMGEMAAKIEAAVGKVKMAIGRGIAEGLEPWVEKLAGSDDGMNSFVKKASFMTDAMKGIIGVAAVLVQVVANFVYGLGALIYVAGSLIKGTLPDLDLVYKKWKEMNKEFGESIYSNFKGIGKATPTGTGAAGAGSGAAAGAGGKSVATATAEEIEKARAEKFKALDAELKEQQRHEIAMAETLGESQNTIEAMKLEHFKNMLALYEKFHQDTKGLLNSIAEQEAKIINPSDLKPKTTESKKNNEEGFFGSDERPSFGDKGYRMPSVRAIPVNPVKESVKELEHLQEGMEFANAAARQFSSSLADGVAAAVLHAQDLGDVFVGLMQMLEEMLIRMMVMKMLSAVGIPTGGGGGPTLLAHSGGNFVGTSAGVMKMAIGGSFTVPGGFPNDSFPLLVESGERVSVTPASGVNSQEATLRQINASIQAMNMNLIRKNMNPVVNIKSDLDSLKFTRDVTIPAQNIINKEGYQTHEYMSVL